MSSMEISYANQEVDESLKERILCQRGNERLDLSLRNISNVPLQLIKDNFDGPVHELDLSYNSIQVISPQFTWDMITLTSLDLSKNLIKKLPDNFGDLQELLYLDLHRNRLETLPLSMGKMHRLKFLRISENPFSPPLKDFLGSTGPGISAVALAGLVVQFLDEFILKDRPEVEVTQSRKSVPSRRSSRAHYNNRNTHVGASGDSSFNSFTSVRNSSNNFQVGDNVLEPDSPRAARESFTGVFLPLMISVVVLLYWLFVWMPIFLAVFVDPSFLEEKAREYPTFGVVWNTTFKQIYGYARSLTSWLPRNASFTLIGCPQPTDEDEWMIIQLAKNAKNALTNKFF